ncbi:MAG TPA: hypothetical protein VMT53_22565 [Terriglobales bacterium]|nr:hypothetical protein [Terriglobales bacterium]
MRAGLAILIAMLVASCWATPPQQSHGHQTEPAPTGTISPELQSLGRSVAIQARPDQVEFFKSAIDSTDEALRESRDLQQLGASAVNTALVNQMSLQLQDALDDVEHYTRLLLASFTRVQETELKKLTRRMRKSYSYVQRDGKRVQQLMEPGKVAPKALATGAANLEKSLSDYRTDEIRLGREMGIQSQ